MLTRHPAAPPLILKRLVTSSKVCPPACSDLTALGYKSLRTFQDYPIRIRLWQAREGLLKIQTDTVKTSKTVTWFSKVLDLLEGCYPVGDRNEKYKFEPQSQMYNYIRNSDAINTQKWTHTLPVVFMELFKLTNLNDAYKRAVNLWWTAGYTLRSCQSTQTIKPTRALRPARMDGRSSGSQQRAYICDRSALHRPKFISPEQCCIFYVIMSQCSFWVLDTLLKGQFI